MDREGPMACVNLTVRLFASLREQAGWNRREVRLEARATPTPLGLWQQLRLGGDRIPAAVRVAINQQFAGEGTTLNDGDEVAFLPPISGG